MAAPAYSSDLTDIFTDGTITGWSALGGGKAGLNQETDYYIQGTSCLSKDAFADATKGMIYNAGAQIIPSGSVVFLWITHLTSGSLDTKANGGLRALIGSSTSDYKHYYVAGSDTIVYDDRWLCVPIDPDISIIASAITGTPTTTKSHFGVLAKMVGGPTKGSPLGIDAIRYGRALIITGGDLSNGYASFDGAATYQDNINRRWGLLQYSGGVYKQQGLFQMGSAGTAVDFRDSNRSVVIAAAEFVKSNFNEFQVVNAASNVEWDNIVVKALGTQAPGLFTVADNATVTLTACTFIGMGAFTLLSNTTVNGCTFNGCGQITTGGADLRNTVVSGYEGSTDTAAVVWDVATDPDGKLDGMSITKGTAATHAIEFGTSTPTSITLRNINFSGYSGTGTSATLNFLRTSGTTTVNLVGCSGTITAQVTGTHTVNFVVNPVTTKITVKDSATKSPIQGAWVYIEAADDTGPLPFSETAFSWSRSGTTATVELSVPHNLSTGQKVLITGGTPLADVSAYGVKTVTVVNSTTFTYTMSDAGPTTGITVDTTGVLISEPTDALGVASDTRSLASDQPVVGWVRKQSSQPYYKQSSISGTVSSTAGLAQDVLLILDE